MGRVAERLEAALASEIAIPTVVLFELYVGIAKSSDATRRSQQLNTLLDAVTVLPFTQDMAKASASIRATLERRGKPIGPLDGLIAGVALAESTTLVTHNTREFARVEGLSLTDWF